MQVTINKCLHTHSHREYSHSSQWAVSPGLSLFVSIAEVQSSLVHSQQLTDAVVAVELSIFIHHLRKNRTSWNTFQWNNISNKFSKCVFFKIKHQLCSFPSRSCPVQPLSPREPQAHSTGGSPSQNYRWNVVDTDINLSIQIYQSCLLFNLQ